MARRKQLSEMPAIALGDVKRSAPIAGRPLRVLLVADARSAHTRRWAEAFSRRGVEVHLASFREPDVAYCQTYLLRTFGMGRAGYLAAVPQLQHLARRLEPDIVNAHHVTSYGTIAWLARCSPLITTAWGSDLLVTPQRSRLFTLITSRALRAADATTVVAEHMVTAALRLGVARETVHTIPFGVDLSLFSWRCPRTPPQMPVRIVCTRALNPVYDVMTLVDALGRLQTVGLDFHTVLIGAGQEEAKIRARIVQHGLASRVSLRGQVSPASVARALADADLFVTPSLSDGNNISLNEAMATGTIPVASAIAANTQWISDERTGFMFQPGNSVDCANAIENAIARSKDWPEIAAVNRAKVEQDADWDRSVEQMVALYYRALRTR